MEQLDTPIGQYDLEELRKIASGIARRVNSSSLDYEDLHHDLVVSLLEGLTLPQACQGIKKKYKGWKKGPSIFVIPQELVSTDPREDNERILTDFERFEIQRQFFEILDQLTPNEKRLMIHVSLGFTNKEIAKCFGLSYGYVRKYKCETMKKMRGMVWSAMIYGL